SVGHSVVYLEPGTTTGQVRVCLDSPTGTVDHTFTNTTGMDIIAWGSSVSGWTIVDEVHAALKPTQDGDGNDGVKIQGGNSGTVKVAAGDGDRLIDIPDTNSSGTRVHVIDDSGSNTYVGNTRFTSSTTHLTLR